MPHPRADSDGGRPDAARMLVVDTQSYLAQAMTEAELQARIKELALCLGWMYYHTRDSRRSDLGFPDLVLVRDENVIIAELKREKGRLTAAQETWGAALSNCKTVDYYLWRPAHWYAGAIEEALR